MSARRARPAVAGLAFDVGTKVYTQLLTAAQLRSELPLAPARE
jgi:hypothetical protein